MFSTLTMLIWCLILSMSADLSYLLVETILYFSVLEPFLILPFMWELCVHCTISVQNACSQLLSQYVLTMGVRSISLLDLDIYFVFLTHFTCFWILFIVSMQTCLFRQLGWILYFCLVEISIFTTAIWLMLSMWIFPGLLP